MIKPNQETYPSQRRHRPPPTGGRFCDTAATTCVQEAHRTLFKYQPETGWRDSRPLHER